MDATAHLRMVLDALAELHTNESAVLGPLVVSRTRGQLQQAAIEHLHALAELLDADARGPVFRRMTVATSDASGQPCTVIAWTTTPTGPTAVQVAADINQAAARIEKRGGTATADTLAAEIVDTTSSSRQKNGPATDRMECNEMAINPTESLRDLIGGLEDTPRADPERTVAAAADLLAWLKDRPGRPVLLIDIVRMSFRSGSTGHLVIYRDGR